MSNKPKRHHFIPDTYQQNFTDNRGQVWVLDKDKKIYSSNPTNIFAEAYFYSLPGETEEEELAVETLLGRIETDFAAIYKNKISKGVMINQEEKGKLAYFVACMFLRTKTMRNNNLNMYKKMLSSMRDWQAEFSTMSDKQKRAIANMPSSGGTRFSIEDIEYAIQNSDSLHTEQIADQLPETANMIFQMKWCILTPKNPDKSFISSDNPFYTVRPESVKEYGPNAFGSTPGLIYKDVEVSLPLSSDKLLFMGWGLHGEALLEIEDDEVEVFNLRSRMRADDKLIAKSKALLEEVVSMSEQL